MLEAEPGIYDAAVAATVSEEGGRSVSANFNVTIDTAGRHIGLHLPREQILHPRTKIPVAWVQLTGSDDLAKPGAMKCVLSRVEWDWIVERVNNQPVWKCSELATPVWSHQFAAGELPGATGRFEITCPGGGCYRLEATDQATGSQTVVQFYACDAEEGELGQLVQQPQRLDIVLDKKTYLPGESAKVLVRSPLAGTMLLTLESDSVLEQRVIDLPRKTTTVDLPLPAALRGGAFVTATVVAPIDPSRPKWLPHRALGVARVELNTAPHRMELSVDAPDKAQPSQKVLVHVKTAPPTDPLHPPMLHLWAVDEGILLTTAFATPSPLDHFLAQRRLEVESSDLYDQLMPDYQRPAGITSIGGGDEADRVRIRSSPIAVRTRARPSSGEPPCPSAPTEQRRQNWKCPSSAGRCASWPSAWTTTATARRRNRSSSPPICWSRRPGRDSPRRATRSWSQSRFSIRPRSG